MTSIPRLAAGLAAVFLLVPPAPAPGAVPHALIVDCTRGQKISFALEHGDARKHLVLNVRGTCNENVTIERDEVTLVGPAVINGSAPFNTVTVRANRVRIDAMAIRGGNHGIALVGANNVEIINTDIQGAQTAGISLSGSASVTIAACSVQHNGKSGVSLEQSGATLGNNNEIRFNGANGVRVAQHSSLTISPNNNISDNAVYGVAVTDGSQAIVSGGSIARNGTSSSTSPLFKGGLLVASSTAELNNANIANNVGRGVTVNMGGTLNMYNTAVSGSTAEGVILYLSATANINGGTISGSGNNGLWISVNSTAQVLGGAAIVNNARHGIELWKASRLWTYEPITVGGNALLGLVCDDFESSAADLANISFTPSNGWGNGTCSGY
jgi:hypothetical protein